MRKRSWIILITISLSFINCKKGLWFRNVNVKLSNNNHHWALVKYKVNGIDSTDLINFGNYPNFKSKFFLAYLSSRNAGTPSFYNRFYLVGAHFEDNNSIFKVTASDYGSGGPPYIRNNDSCKSTSVSDCQRNVFTPENIVTSWKIEKFKFGHLVLTCNQTNNYYLELKATNN